MTEALRMDVEQLREQAGELAIEQHLLLSGWVYGFTDQAHKRIYDLLADDKVLPVDLDKAIIFYTNPSPSPKGQKIGAVGPAASLNMDIYLPAAISLRKSSGFLSFMVCGSRRQYFVFAPHQAFAFPLCILYFFLAI